MRRIKQAKPSAALIVAVVALVAALGGGAVAGVAVTSLSKKDKKQVTKIAKKQGKKQGKKQANKQIAKKAPGLSVASATTADSAKTANSADVANGVKPVKVSLAAAADSGTTVFVNEGGIRIEGECDSGGHAVVRYEGTADDGDPYLSIFIGGSPIALSPPDFDVDSTITVPTSPIDKINQTTVTYRGADGTTVSGELVQVEGTGTAQCRIGGTLFVG